LDLSYRCQRYFHREQVWDVLKNVHDPFMHPEEIETMLNNQADRLNKLFYLHQ
jgi:hypothetical protein